MAGRGILKLAPVRDCWPRWQRISHLWGAKSTVEQNPVWGIANYDEHSRNPDRGR
jgi:hypothetical protein